jgi:hypothetical protein
MAQENRLENSVEEQTLNPEIDLTQESGVVADSGDFFESLDREVNGMILDSNEVDNVEEQVTQPLVAPSVNVGTDDHQHDWEKRYKDSSREAQKMKERLEEVSEFAPLIDRLKDDTGMVDAIRQYVEGGSKPQDVKQALDLPEDFVFDLDEAVTDKNSMSAKALEHTISGVVDHRVNTRLQQDDQTRKQDVRKSQKASEAQEFKDRMKMTDDTYTNMMDWANKHETSLEDIYYLQNRDSRDQNVAKGAKNEMLKQMKSVREIPGSVSNHNATVAEFKHDDMVFDSLKSVDEGLEGIFNMDN